MGPVNPVFLKHVIVTISTFVEWDHLKKIMVHNENGINQKGTILLKPFLNEDNTIFGK